MTGDGGIIKRTYDLVALFVLLNVLGAGGLAGYMVSSGMLDGKALRAIGLVLKGKELVPVRDDTEEPQTETPDQIKKTLPPVRSDDDDIDNADPQAQVEIEILQRESERIQVELEQKLNLINSMLLRVKNEREAFERERKQAKQADVAEKERRRDEGFEKQIAIFQSLSPKIAVKHLLGMSDPGEAAKILIALDTDKARKIVEAARRGDDLAKMEAILQRMRDAAPDQSTKIENPNP